MGCHFGSRNPTHLQNEPFFHTHPPFWVRNVCRSKETNDTWVLQLPNLTAANSRTQQLRQSNTTQKAAPLQLWGWDGWNQLSHITLHVSRNKNCRFLCRTECRCDGVPFWLKKPHTPAKWTFFPHPPALLGEECVSVERDKWHMGVAAAKPNSCKFKDTAAEAIQHHSKGSAVALVGLGWMESTIPHNTACVSPIFNGK